MLNLKEGYKNIEKVHEDGITAWYIGEKNGEWYTWDDFPDGDPQYIGRSREEAISLVQSVVNFLKNEHLL